MSLSAVVTINPTSTIQKDSKFNATVTVTGTVALPEVSTVSTVADVAGSLNSKFFIFNAANDLTRYYVWYNINGAGVDPAPSGRTGFMVAAATAATANTIASLTRAAIVNANFSISGATNQVIITNTANGPTTATADGSAPTGFAFVETQVGINSVPFQLASAQPQVFLTSGSPTNGAPIEVSEINVYVGNLLQSGAVSVYNFDGVCHSAGTYTVSAILYDTSGNNVSVTPASLVVLAVV